MTTDRQQLKSLLTAAATAKKMPTLRQLPELADATEAQKRTVLAAIQQMRDFRSVGENGAAVRLAERVAAELADDLDLVDGEGPRALADRIPRRF